MTNLLDTIKSITKRIKPSPVNIAPIPAPGPMYAWASKVTKIVIIVKIINFNIFDLRNLIFQIPSLKYILTNL